MEDTANLFLSGKVDPKKTDYVDHRIAMTLASNGAVSLNGFERNLFFENTGDRFEYLGALSGIDSNVDARSFAYGDIDRDGDLDLVVKNLHRKLLELYRNDSTEGRRGIFVRAIGTRSNRDAIGTRVLLEMNGARRKAEIRSASGFQAQSPNEVFFGLGNADAAESLELRFPSGAVQRVERPEAGHVYVVHEEDGVVEKRPIGGARADEGPDGGAEAAAGASDGSPTPTEAAAFARLAADERTDIRRQTIFSKPREALDVKTGSFDTKAVYRRPTLVCFTTTWSASLDRDLEELARLKRETEGLEVLVFYVKVAGPSMDAKRFPKTEAMGFGVSACEVNLANHYAQQSSPTFPSTFLVTDGTIVLDIVGPLDAAVVAEAIGPKLGR